VRRLISARATEDQIREAAQEGGMLTLGEDALAKVKAGLTTAEELLRVVTEVKELRTLCSGCGGAVALDFHACPQCGKRLSGACPSCNRVLQPGWQFCPYCARNVDAAPAPEQKPERRLRQRKAPRELPASNVAEFKKGGAT
jgi:RNA polymerase subunit RPABC4/transcription elongation factor Spt4